MDVNPEEGKMERHLRLKLRVHGIHVLHFYPTNVCDVEEGRSSNKCVTFLMFSVVGLSVRGVYFIYCDHLKLLSFKKFWKENQSSQVVNSNCNGNYVLNCYCFSLLQRHYITLLQFNENECLKVYK